ncbi:MAG: ABC transporter ATP-binding protein [Euryarchaeota archaeon]|nr:ABC transporter ATP-binding protein [Euryarchaeota archaeon]
MLAVQNLTKNFGKVVAVYDLSFEVRPGEVFGLLGTNGAGKTTTMKILATLLKPTAGKAFVDGIDVLKYPTEVKRRIGYLPETPALYEKLTAREFLQMLGSLREMEPIALRKRLGYLEKALEMGEFLDLEIGTYSKGMRQRAAFASAVLHEPPVLILDEPTSGLDPRFAKLVKGWVRDYARGGRTVLMSTHVTEIAESLCDRTAIIDRGQIAALDAPAALKERLGAATLEDAFVQLVEPRRK